MNNDVIIPAATILLLRDRPDLEVLMIERHANIGFAGGALVFPGGRIEKSDADAQWRDHANGLPENTAMAAGMVAAAREAFEETGILYARDQKGAFVSKECVAELQAERPAIEANDRLFLEMIVRENLSLACDGFVLFAHWVAPPAMHKRFDTLFFATLAPDGHDPQPDGNEATEALWIGPQDVLKARASGERKVIFPTARNVELLARSATARGVLADAGRRPIERIEPTVVKREDGMFLTIPDTLGYPITEEELSSAERG
ncbi:MAG: NUDIX hydrolase [Pseudomonadota bacterium]